MTSFLVQRAVSGGSWITVDVLTKRFGTGFTAVSELSFEVAPVP